jgi:SAM-dependent methyltransferase
LHSPVSTKPGHQSGSSLVRLDFDSNAFDRWTHYLFRYPAKFHPPVARALLDRYTRPGDVVLDPFCGSGTLLVEALASGRAAKGVDIDPLAVFVTNAKLAVLSERTLTRTLRSVKTRLRAHERPAPEYERRQFEDIAESTLRRTRARESLWIPNIPNIRHWFRRYVIIDLARIRRAIDDAAVSERYRRVLLLAFASIVRAASNADPVPVSGLEVTAHMKRRDAEGRLINPFKLFERALDRHAAGYIDFADVAARGVAAVARHGDATRGRKYEGVDAVITSPPYHNAVDYYRRHQLETFWLGLVSDQQSRLRLKHRYIGRHRISKTEEALLGGGRETPFIRRWHDAMGDVSAERARDFRHYAHKMHRALERLSRTLQPGARCIFVVGHSSWNGNELSTTTLFQELADPWFTLEDVLWYPVRNRYMSYARHNKASIDQEYVLAFTRKGW